MVGIPNKMSVAELHSEAVGLLRRWKGAKLPNHASLDNVRLAAEAKGIDKLVAADSETVALRSEIEQAWLWECAVNRSGPRNMTYACVAISLLIMFLVGSLYVFYNQGTSLLAEMQALSAKQPDRRFGQLERQLIAARAELFAGAKRATAGGDCTPGADGKLPAGCVGNEEKIDELAREASYALLYDLRDLNTALTSLEGRLMSFNQLATAPVPGLGRLWNWAGTLWTGAAPNQANAAGESVKTESGTGNPNAAKGTSADFTTNHFCAPNDDLSAGGAGQAGNSRAVPRKAYPKVLGMDMNEITEQACDYSLGYVSMTVPPVNLWALQVKAIITPYATWILPALFACLGAMIYFMRLLADPTQPSPRLNRIVHRMALAALAGVIVGWFWEPAFGASSEFQAAGLGLFTFAFVVGFSIELFFSLLDRFVEISGSAIERLGS
jgi:hypothetical protein